MQSETKRTVGARDSVSAVAARVVARVQKMTPEERVQVFVKAGVIRKDGTLTPAYGGA